MPPLKFLSFFVLFQTACQVKLQAHPWIRFSSTTTSSPSSHDDRVRFRSNAGRLCSKASQSCLSGHARTSFFCSPPHRVSLFDDAFAFSSTATTVEASHRVVSRHDRQHPRAVSDSRSQWRDWMVSLFPLPSYTPLTFSLTRLAFLSTLAVENQPNSPLSSSKINSPRESRARST